MQHTKKKSWWLTVALTALAAVLTLGGLTLRSLAGEMVLPERASSAEPQEPAELTPSASATPKPPVIKESDILSLKIPNLKIDVKASGATMPRKSERCHASTVCIDPPIFKEVAWYGAFVRPAYPSKGSTVVFGHSNWRNRENQAFNNLPKAERGDRVVATTRKGVFTYRVKWVGLEDYARIHLSKRVYGNVPGTLVLVTCNAYENAATVVVAELESAKTR